MLLSIVYATSEPNRGPLYLTLATLAGTILFAISVWLAMWANRGISFTFDTATIRGRTQSMALRIALFVGMFGLVIAGAAALITLIAIL
jgi:hypothetical protein